MQTNQAWRLSLVTALEIFDRVISELNVREPLRWGNDPSAVRIQLRLICDEEGTIRYIDAVRIMQHAKKHAMIGRVNRGIDVICQNWKNTFRESDAERKRIRDNAVN